MTRAGLIPNYPFFEPAVRGAASDAPSVHVGRFEDSIQRQRNRREPHRHDHDELFVLTGRGRFSCDARESKLQGSRLVVVSAGQVHAWPEADGLRGVMFAFSREFVEPGHGARTLWSTLFTPSAAPLAPVAVPSGASREVQGAARLALQEFRAGEPGWPDVVRAQLHVLLTLTVRWQPSAATVVSAEARLTRDFRAALEANFRRLGRMRDYGRLLRVTEAQLTNAVQSTTGRTPSELWRARVLLEARRCLTYSRLDIAEIAYGLGFKDPSYFARFFRRETGTGPREFRASLL